MQENCCATMNTHEPGAARASVGRREATRWVLFISHHRQAGRRGGRRGRGGVHGAAGRARARRTGESAHREGECCTRVDREYGEAPEAPVWEPIAGPQGR
jgi:hypothetical protein